MPDVVRPPWRRLDESLKAAVLEVQTYVLLVVAAAGRALVTPPRYWGDLIQQLDVVGVGSLTVVLMMAFFTGAVLALQTGITLDLYGAKPAVGRVVSATLIKNLGPVLTGLMLSGRAGAGIAAELGSMEVTSQLSALRMLGTDPVRKLVLPRILAGTLMTPILTAVADFVGILGGWGVARTQLGVGSGLYWSSVLRTLVMEDLWMGLLKPVALGFVVVSIACHMGLRTTGGTHGVGLATTRAVVSGSVAVIAVDFFLTRLMITLWY